MHFTRILLPAVFVLLASTNIFAGTLDKVEICHFSDTQVKLISISQNALEDHLVHGDIELGGDIDESCQLPPQDFCIVADYADSEYFGAVTEYYQVQYFPSTGEVFGGYVFAPLPGLEGRVSPLGLPAFSIFSSGSTFRYNFNWYDFDWDLFKWVVGGNWTGAGLAVDNSGTFIGAWESGEGYGFYDTGYVEYSFVEGSSCPPDL